MTEKTTSEPFAFVTLLTKWNTEIFSLYSKRMQEYAMLPLNLMLCSSPDDRADLHDKFAATLKTDYASAAERLALLACGRGLAGDASESYANTILAAQEDARAIIGQAQEQARRILDDAHSRMQDATAGPRNSEAA